MSDDDVGCDLDKLAAAGRIISASVRETPQIPGNENKPGDPGWLAAHAELVELHRRKSATYGTVGEPLLNFVEIGLATGKPPTRYVWERILEKAIRALNMHDAGLEDDVKEAMDVSSLALCAEALRRRRL